MAMESVDVLAWLRNRLEAEDGDLVREMLQAFAERLMSAEADALCGAPKGARTPDRTNQRNGYRSRRWDTRAGTIELEIPKLRKGSYFPDWLLEPRRRAERALVAVICEAYVQGVSTRNVEALVQAMGLTGISKSQVSALAQELDALVEEFRNRPLEGGSYPYVWLDALMHKSREGGRVVSVATLVAIGVSESGHREILGLEVVTSEDGAGWLAFLRSLVARGLSGVRLVISDAHAGLIGGVAAALPGASWQRCRTHFLRNLLTRVPKAAQDFVATLVRSIFAQPDAEAVWAQCDRVAEQLSERFPEAARKLDEAREEILAFSAFPKEHWKQIWSNNPLERLNKEIRRRTDVVGIFPNRAALIRLVGAILAEQNDEWMIARRYMAAEALAKVAEAPCLPEPHDPRNEVTPQIQAA
jgi:putative transposase